MILKEKIVHIAGGNVFQFSSLKFSYCRMPHYKMWIDIIYIFCGQLQTSRTVILLYKNLLKLISPCTQDHTPMSDVSTARIIFFTSLLDVIWRRP